MIKKMVTNDNIVYQSTGIDCIVPIGNRIKTEQKRRVKMTTNTKENTKQNIDQILRDAVEELEENGCMHELQSHTPNMIIFNYSHYWDSYPEFSDDIALETENLLALSSELQEAGFVGYLYVNEFVKKINL